MTSRFRLRGSRSFFISAFLLSLSVGLASGQTYYEKWNLNTGGINEGDFTFADKWVGPDMLPYTADDEDLPQYGNAGGTWTASWIDNDGDGVFSPGDFRFTIVRRDDDDQQSLGANSEFNHGVIAEGEDWFDFHNADNTGPCHPETVTDPNLNPDGTPCDLFNEDRNVCTCSYGDDFEHDDALSSWEDKDNWFWYNSVKANQRGLGGSKFYFEWKDAAQNPGYFDETQKWRKGLKLARSYNPPENLLPEGRFCSGYNPTIKGLLIPVSAMAGLKKGELDPLFGWYPGDMAEYVRDVLLPRLEDSNLSIYLNSSDCSASGLPPAYVMIQQGEYPIQVENAPNPQASAAYFGITPSSAEVNADGFLPTSSVYRWSAILILWEKETPDDPDNAPELISPKIDLGPEDGLYKNLWARDTFDRNDFTAGVPDDLGYLTLGCDPSPDTCDPIVETCCWTFALDVPDPSDTASCNDHDHALYLPAGTDNTKSWAQLPITGLPSLDASKGKVHGEVDLNIVDTPNSYVHIILSSGTKPVALATIHSGDKAILGVGGSDFSAGFPFTPALTGQGSAVLNIPSDATVYSRLDLALDAAAKMLEISIDGSAAGRLDYSTVDFNLSQVDSLRVWFEAGTGAVDQMAILQEFSPCGDTPEVAVIAGAPAAPVDLGTVTLDGSGSSAGPFDGGTISYQWSIVSGPAAIDGAADAATVKILGNAAGDVVVKLTVDDHGCDGSNAGVDQKTITFKGTAVTKLHIRGDANDDASIDLSDAVQSLNYQFIGVTEAPHCTKSLDFDGNGKLEITDPVNLLNVLFLGSTPPDHFRTCEAFDDAVGDDCVKPETYVCPAAP